MFLSAIVFTTLQITSKPTGAPQPASGAPAEGGATCATSGCHYNSVSTVTNVLSTDIPVAGYTPGNTYNITVVVTGTGWKGFMVSPQNSVGTALGTLYSGSGSKIVFTNYITHSTDKSGTPAIWTFQWKAPAAGSGDITFYGAFAITLYNTQKQTLTVHENTGTITPPVVSTLASSNITSSSATLNGTVNTNGKQYAVSFQYKTPTTSWIFSGATPSTLNCNTATPFSLNVSNILPNTTVTYRACAWNTGDTTWGTIQTFTTNMNTGIELVTDHTNFSVFPNPATTNLTIGFNLTQQAEVKINLLNMEGKYVHSFFNRSLSAGIQTLKLDLNEMKPGIYFLQMHVNDGVSYKKILID